MNEFKAVVITVSDGCFYDKKEDKSGPELAMALQSIGIAVNGKEVIPDDRSTITSILQKHIADQNVNLIVTTGGTGFGPRDVTPEATREVIERPAPGIAELLRREGASQTILSWTSRGEAGIAGNTLIINLPGSTRAMTHSVTVLKPILFHALELLAGRKPH